jgi:hypothetical protein
MRYDRMFPKNETRSNHFVGLNDIYATLADIVGVKVPQFSAKDSVSFANYIKSGESTQELRKYLGTWAYIKGSIIGEAIRFGDYKLIRNYAKGNDEMYNLKEDMGESNNIINGPEYSTMLMDMYKVLQIIGPCSGGDETNPNITLTYGNKAGKVVTCAWFKVRPKRRCDKQPVGPLMCNSICGSKSISKLCRRYPG